jgi:four helix bundle protein
MESKIKQFKDLKAWQEGYKMVLIIYRITNRFPKEELYCLTSQMRRAAISVTSNIAEGFGRIGYKDKLRFYYLANGSITELKNQINIAFGIGYVKALEIKELVDKTNSTHKILNGLIRSTKNHLNKPD